VLLKILVGSRALNRTDILLITSKLKKFTSPSDREMLDAIMRNELYNYNAVHTDSPKSVVDLMWQITNDITSKTEITITYIKMNRTEITRRILPAAVMFSEYYFYLIAFHSENGKQVERFYRVDRITSVVEHRSREFPNMEYDEGELRKHNQYMFPGKKMMIKFEFGGPSVQAVLDKLPTARIVEVKDGKNIIEAEVYGDGIKMFLLSQGSWVKVIAPQSLVDDIREEAERILKNYR
jgi:predicted DNA-binding transcriptional regulator YafY